MMKNVKNTKKNSKIKKGVEKLISTSNSYSVCKLNKDLKNGEN